MRLPAAKTTVPPGRPRLGRGERDRPASLRLALREISGNVTLTDSAAWVWFVLPTQQWSFRSDAHRLNLLVGTADAYAALAGRRLHLRATSRPYPAAVWARALDDRTPAPLPGVPGDTWADHLVRAQQHLRAATLAEKEVYLGVRIVGRSGLDRLVERLLRRATAHELGRVAAVAERITEVVTGPGLGGRAASTAEVEWLLRRSVGLGLPAPAQLDPAGLKRWERDDLPALVDGVEYAGEPLGRTVRVRGRAGDDPLVQRHVAVLSLGRMPEIDVPDAAHDPWLAHADRMPFPVEWSIRADVLSGVDAERAVAHRLLVIRDMQRHYREHDLDEPLVLERQAHHARMVEDEMTSGLDATATRVHGWFRVAVAAATEAECLERARKLAAAYRGRRVAVEHPKAQHALLREFIPGEPVATTAYRRRMPVLYFAAGLPTAAANLGDGRGPAIGATCGGSRRAVMFDTHYATEVRETSGLVPVTGGLGAGKSVLMGQITYEAVRRGIPAVMLDPSGPLARLCQLPELREHARHLDLTAAPPGTLNPYAVVVAPTRGQYPDRDRFEEAKVLAAQDRKLLALDIARMLLPPSVDAMPATPLVLADAIRSAGATERSSLWAVVEHLKRHEDSHGRVVAAYLRDMAEMPLARLFFPASYEAAPQSEATLTVLTMPGLVLPPRGVPREHWSTAEQLAVPLLHLAAWYATRAIYGRPMHDRKLVALDETHFLGDWGAGRALFTRLGRDSRKWNACVLAASQNPADVLGMDVANFLSAAFVGRIEDEETAADALRMLRVPIGVGYERVLATLSPPDAAGRRAAYREFVMRDVDGRVDKVRVDLSTNPRLLAALDTTAASQTTVGVRDDELVRLDPDRDQDQDRAVVA